MEKYIKFLVDTFGNYAGDIVELEYEDDTDVYYTDGFDRSCYLPKLSMYIDFIIVTEIEEDAE